MTSHRSRFVFHFFFFVTKKKYKNTNKQLDPTSRGQACWEQRGRRAQQSSRDPGEEAAETPALDSIGAEQPRGGEHQKKTFVLINFMP